MIEALREAKKAEAINEVPIGCVIVLDKVIIARGHNLKESLMMASAHAEVLAVQKASLVLGGWRLTNCEVYVTIEPCAMCAGLLYQARVKRIVFGAFDYKGGACGGSMNVIENSSINHKVLLTSGILEASCQQVVSNFFKRKRT